MKNLKQLFFCITILLNLISFKSFAQVPEWEWAKSPGGVSGDNGVAITKDKEGNLYVTGVYTTGSVTFGSATLENAGTDYSDIFLVKYDPQGNVIWAKSAGGIHVDECKSIAIDKAGDIYITGRYSSPSIKFGSTTLYNSGLNDIFIAKYDSNGNLIWAKSIGGNRHDYGNSIAIDKDDNVYVTGTFSSSSITFDSETFNMLGINNMFIVKYNSTGNVLWAKSMGYWVQTETVKSIVDDNGNIYTTGSFFSPITFGTTTLNNSGETDMFIVKFDSIGNVLWAKSAGGSKYDGATDLIQDIKGNIHATGYFESSSITFDTITLSKALNGIYKVIYDREGNVLSATTEGGGKMTMDDNGNIYAVGSYQDSSLTFGTWNLRNNSKRLDIFIVKYDINDNIVWAKSIGSTADDYGRGVITDNKENIYVVGDFCSPSINFGSITLNKTKGDIVNMFIAKLKSTSTSISENITKTSASIFPNPTASQFHITNLEPGNWTITIYTLDGQSVFKKELTEANATIDLSGKAKGAYVYRLLKDGEVFKSGKIVVK